MQFMQLIDHELREKYIDCRFSCIAGWPREVALPGLPRIRSCEFPATYVVDNISCLMWRA
jgi:hypothetical protein